MAINKIGTKHNNNRRKSQVLLCIHKRIKRIILCERSGTVHLYKETLNVEGFDKTKEHRVGVVRKEITWNGGVGQ